MVSEGGVQAKVFDRKASERPPINADYTTTRTVGQLKLWEVNVTAMHDACASQCHNCAKHFLRHGADPEPAMMYKGFPAWFGESALHPWMYEALTDFQEKGHKQFRYPVISDVRPVHIAAKRGCAACIETFANHGARLNESMALGLERSYYQRTAAGFQQVNVMGVDACFIQALDLALAFGKEMTAMALLNAGVPISRITVDSKGKLLDLNMLPG